MTILLNGKPLNTTATSLADILGEAGFGDAVVATAVNSEFVPHAMRAACELRDGDQIEVLAPMQGG